ncbi:MAG: hypothetical protein JNJ45_00345 [Chthonomonas sp.]|nr:hypothetical protein [Chthonomonas sp.]
MSISQVKKLSEHKGCSWTIGVLMILALGTSMFQCQGNSTGGGADQASKEIPLGMVGSTPILLSQVSDRVRAIEEQQPNQSLAAEIVPDVYGNMLFNSVEAAYALETVKRAGFKPTDEEIINQFNASINSQLEQMRMQMIIQKKLKSDATDQDFAAAFEKEAKRPLEQARKEALDGFRKALADPTKREAIIAEGSLSLYGEKLKDELTFDDADLKVSRDILMVKRIYSKDPAKIESAQKDLKAGQSFEDVMEKYSEDMPEEGKRLRDSTQNLPVGMVLGTAKAELKSAKQSSTVGPLPTEEGQAIYFIVKRTVNPIKEFDKIKASVRDEVVGQAASTIRTEKIAAVRKEGVTWKSDGAKNLFTVYSDNFDPKNPAMITKYEGILESPLSGESEADRRLTIFSRQIALQRLMKAWTQEQKTKNIERILATTEEYLGTTESVGLRLELTKNLIAAKRPEAAGQLVKAIQANSGFEPVNEANFGNLGATLLSLKNAKLGTPEEIKAAEDLLKQWRQDKLATDKERAEIKKQGEKIAEDERKAAEAEKKAAEAEKKAADATKAKDKAPSSKDLTGEKTGN